MSQTERRRDFSSQEMGAEGMGALNSFICDRAFSALGPSWGMARLWEWGQPQVRSCPSSIAK